MCNDKETIPTPKQLETIKYGYKIFVVGGKKNVDSNFGFIEELEREGLVSLYRNSVYKLNDEGEVIVFECDKFIYLDEHPIIDGFYTVKHPTPVGMGSLQRGFHVFRKKKEAFKYARQEFNSRTNLKFIVQKVEIRNLVALGEYSGRCTEKLKTYRCGGIKLVGKPRRIIKGEAC